MAFEAYVGEDARRVVHDHIHSGKLLHHLKRDAEPDRAAEICVRPEETPTALRPLQLLFDIEHLLVHQPRVAAQRLEDSTRLILPTAHHQPTRAPGKLDDADQEKRARNRDNPQHPSPGADVGEQRVGDEGGQDAHGDHELIARYHRAALIRWRDLGNIERGGEGRDADRYAENHAGDDEGRDRPGAGAQ